VSKAKPGLTSISANLSYAHCRDVIARFVLQQRELKRLTSAGLAFPENARSALATFSHRPVELNFVPADFANPALG
jgi:hypothetical protein